MSSDKLNRFDNEKFKMHLKAWQEKQSNVKGGKIKMEDIVADLAERLHVSESAVEHWKKGHNKPSDYNKMIELAKALEISPEDLEKEKIEKDKVISMTENNVIDNSLVEENTTVTETENTMKQFKLMSSSMNDMFDMMKKYQEISGTSKNAVLSVYHDISDFLETYRSLEYGKGIDILSDKFNAMYRNFRKLRLEMPKIVYDTLENFMGEYLLMIIGIDSALPSYLKEAESRKNDFIEFADSITRYITKIERTKMTKELWVEYLSLKTFISNQNTKYDIEYKDHVDELFCDYELENNSRTDNYVLAAMFMTDLYHWLNDMWFLIFENLEWFYDNTKFYKATFIKDAYRHLDEILSAYIP